MKYQVEYTDTFCGEANYCWVNRASFNVAEDASDLAIVRKAKLALGLNGVRCKREWWGETLVLRPCNSNTIVFINYCEGESC